MPQIDIADDTFISAPLDAVVTATADRSRWARWWPDLRLRVSEDSGSKGTRWRVAGALTGTMEIWLEPVRHGVVVHYFLRADFPDERVRRTRASKRARERRRRAFRREMWSLKDELEAAARVSRTAPVGS